MSKRRERVSMIGLSVAAGVATLALAGGHSASGQGASGHQAKAREVAWVTPAKNARVLSPGGEYTVRAGDTLALIAGREYGNYGCWRGIYSANSGAIRNPDLIYVGQTLSIPEGCGMRGPVQTVSVSQPDPKAAPPQGNEGGAAPGSFQACVISRESGGNPRAVNPSSGAGGLYQFLPSTWAALGYSGLPEDAPVWEQNQAFDKAYAEWGTSPWRSYDGC